MLDGVAPHPNPLPQGEREPEVASVKRVIANSTVSGQNLVGSHGGRRHAGVSGSPNSGFLYFSLPYARPVPVKVGLVQAGSGSGLLTRPASATAGVVARKELKVYLNETAPRWENHSHPASPRRPCFAPASRHKSLAQTAPLARATNLLIKANPVPPHGFVQEPVPERPERLAVKPSSAPALRVQASSFSLPHARPVPLKRRSSADES